MKNRFLFGFFILLAVTSSTYAQCSDVQFYTSATGDTIRIKETFNTEDSSTNEYLKERLKPIQSNFKRINSITKWSSVKKKSIEGESAEGGEATFYYNNKQLEKVIARHYGEMGQTLVEYYLMNGKLSFVFEKDYRYNRPLFYDEKTMKENNDTEAFDFEKSEITEIRNYFEKGNLIHILDSQDCGAPFSGDYIAGEEKKISKDFKRLIRLTE
ncbi:hypothetical protein [Chryseobacterium pennipullorum]|uniref:GLPGLI family protein n=1 Tax=Chryseobacterium pennipullorum TaxID=2258963 RepID=A0A3D9B2C5_9FLAO|nr:hypothetical protein [Chryseobacterium pennipullorum]REC47800.1 hypothetical protein DRF67_10090 [Chryseobacterium pennipullorum]